MDIQAHTNITQLLWEVPECREQLYPFILENDKSSTLASLTDKAGVPFVPLKYGIERTIKRAKQNPCDYQAMRAKLIKPGAVNIAGFVNFLWHKKFVAEMERKALELGIELNINIFPKHTKKQFQNYLAVCKSADDLPELLIGKGFSSLMTQQFIGQFVKSGHYQHKTDNQNWGEVFRHTILEDKDNCYHPFGVEEMVMAVDNSVPVSVKKPESWNDLLQDRYAGHIMQMGKNQRDHFGFNMMLYLFTNGGEESVKKYSSNVKNKQHFSQIIRGIGSNNAGAASINIVHQFASLFIRSDVRDKIELIEPKDGNPVTCHFYLAKQNIGKKAMQMINHLYSLQIKTILEECGTTHITSDRLFSGNKNFRWVGWDTIKSLPLPYLKEYLSEIAYQNFKTMPL